MVGEGWREQLAETPVDAAWLPSLWPLKPKEFAIAENTADFLLARLRAWGIHRIYGYPGDGINVILGAFNRAGSDPELIQVRHEEMAAFMACAHAKFTGEVGVCMATSGPGAIHLLNGLYDAKLDHQPVVAIVGQTATPALGGSYQQEVDLTTLFKDVAHEYVEMASSPEQMRHLVDRAVRIAKDQRTVTCLIIPNDVAGMAAVETPPRAHGTIHSSLGYSPPTIVPTQDDLSRAAEALNAGKKVAMLAGAGALGAADELIEVAELLGAGVAKALLGKAVLPDDLPFVTGSIGLLGTKPSWDLMMDCDTLLMVGSSFPYSEFLPDEGQARGVQIDIDGRMLGIRYPMEVQLVGDSKATLQALIPLLERKEDRSWRGHVEHEVGKWWELMEERALESADPINPQRLFFELSKRLPDNAILSSDSGSAANWFARDVKIRKGMMASLSGESPRLLLHSTSKRFPHGLANTHDQVGRHVMVQGAPQVAGRFPELLRMYKAPPPEISSEDFYETDPARGFARGFSIQTVSPLPIGWAEHVLADGHRGAALREYMRDYNHWTVLGSLCELLPLPENRVTLAGENDQFGMPAARFDYTQCDNDRANIAFAKKTMHAIWETAGAQDVLTIDRYAHLVGGCRMGFHAETSVIDSDHRVWEIPNLFVCDGSVMPTQGSANPALTIMALASRLAERLSAKRVPTSGSPRKRTTLLRD